MATKTLGTIIVVFICLLVLPVGIGIVGAVFGTIIGVFGAVFGAVFGIIGGIFSAIFGLFGWLFEGLFGWSDFGWHVPFGFVECNILTWAIIVIIVAMLIKGKKNQA